MIPVRTYQHEPNTIIANEITAAILECRRTQVVIHLYNGCTVLYINKQSKPPLESDIPNRLMPDEWANFWNKYNIEFKSFILL